MAWPSAWQDRPIRCRRMLWNLNPQKRVWERNGQAVSAYLTCISTLLIAQKLARWKQRQGDGTEADKEAKLPKKPAKNEVTCMLALPHWEMACKAESAPSEMKLRCKTSCEQDLNPRPESGVQLSRPDHSWIVDVDTPKLGIVVPCSSAGNSAHSATRPYI